MSPPVHKRAPGRNLNPNISRQSRRRRVLKRRAPPQHLQSIKSERASEKTMGKTPEKPYSTASNMLAMGLRYRRKVPAPAAAVDSENSNSSNKESVADAPMVPTSAAAVAAKHEKLKKQRRHQVRTNQDEELIQEPLTDSKAQSKVHNNQLEHREDAGDNAVVANSSSSSQPEPSSPVVNEDGPASYTRKKKHKAGIANSDTTASVTTKKKVEKLRKEAVHPRVVSSTVTKENAPVEPTVVTAAEASIADPGKQGAVVISVVGDTVVVSPKSKRQKKKKKQQQRSDPDESGGVVTESDEPSDKSSVLPTEQSSASTADAQRPTAVKEMKKIVKQPQQQRKEDNAPGEQLRRRKQFNNRKENGSSLMKQLLWKVKAVVKPVEAPAAPVVIEQVEESSVQATEEQEEEDEEIAFAAEERRSLKLKASSLAKVMSCPVESSSQETQSGSEDESSFIQYNFLSSEDVHSVAGSELELQESSFPTSLSLDIVASVKARHSKVQVHEILLEDFAFKPVELFIAQGDLVVWRVSEQTLGMVEHSLDATLFDMAGALTRKTSTPLLGPGNGFAWRFDVAGRVDVQCSVYNFHCVVHINDVDIHAAKQNGVVANSTVARTMTNSQRRKKKAAAKALKRAAKVAPQPEADIGDEVETRSDNSEPVAVFHPVKDLMRVPEMDAGVCRAVLTQLEEVKAAAEAVFIVVGDISCPLVEEADDDDIVDAGLDEVEDDDKASDGDNDNDEVGDFQQRIIAMLQKSEESQARQRSSFMVKSSGFDAGSAYDFFKRRFARVQSAEELVMYARCPERRSSHKVELADLLNVLMAKSE